MSRLHRSGRRRTGRLAGAVALAVAALTPACEEAPPASEVRASGYVEATEVRLAVEVGGRLVELLVDEGDRVEAGDTLARLDTADTELAIRRVQAERRQAEAQLRLLRAGARPEDVRQAEARVQVADAEVRAAEVEEAAAARDLERFEALVQSRSGSRKQRDDAAARHDVAQARVAAARESLQAAREMLARVRAGARVEEVDVARARLDAAEAQVATLEKRLADATLVAPASGIVTEKLADVGELLLAGSPILVVTDLEHAWANIYIAEPLVPRVRLGQAAAVETDAGGAGLEGRVTFVSSRAEFTPRNVQTAEERAKLVYRIKIAVDNRDGILKQGMPVEAVLPLAPLP